MSVTTSSDSALTYPFPSTADTDIVSLSALQLAVTVGPDHWHRNRPQPAHLFLSLHLTPSYLNVSGLSDDVADSLHYGHLAKAAERRVGERAEKEGGYTSARALVEDVTDAAFGFAVDATRISGDVHGDSGVVALVRAVRVVLRLPKQILLAGGFEVELTTSAMDWASGAGGLGSEERSKASAIVRVTDLVLPVIIGVNPPERLAKQRVVTHLTFFEAPQTNAAGIQSREANVNQIDYPAIVQEISTEIEKSSHLTLEKLVYEIIRTAYCASDAQSNSSNPNRPQIQAITARCQKPSALSFAGASEVEMTRTRETL